MTYVLGLDIGTTFIKAVVFDVDAGEVISTAKRSTPSHNPQPAFTEHDPDELWKRTADCIKETSNGYRIAGLSISSFAEAGLPLDEHDKPLYPVIAWYDPRSQPQVDNLLDTHSETMIYQITGQKPGFSFGLFKMLWLFDNYPNIRSKFKSWLSVPDYILYRLTGEKYTDHTQASRTLLFDQSKRTWSPKMLEIAGIDESILPKIVPSGTVIGATMQSIADITGLPPGIPCSVGGHDHLCGAFASGGFTSSLFLDSMGTSQAVLCIMDHFSLSKNTIEQGFVNYSYVIPSLFILKGGIKAAGKAFEWFYSTFGKVEEEQSKIKLISSDNDRPFWLPYFHGSGTPNRQPTDRAVLFGLNLDHTREDIYLSLIEGLSFWLKENINAMSHITGISPNKILVIGGANQNRLMQKYKSSALNLPLVAPSVPEASAVGAALLAAYGCGLVKSYEEAGDLIKTQPTTIKPDLELVPVLQDRFQNGFIPLRKNLGGMQSNFFKKFKIRI